MSEANWKSVRCSEWPTEPFRPLRGRRLTPRRRGSTLSHLAPAGAAACVPVLFFPCLSGGASAEDRQSFEAYGENRVADPFQEYRDLIWGTGPYAANDPSDGPATSATGMPPDQAASSSDPSGLPPTNVGILGPLSSPEAANTPQDQGKSSSVANNAAAAGRYYLPGVGETYLDPAFATNWAS